MLETLDHYYPMQRPSIEDSPGQENIILNHSRRHPNKREFSGRLWNHIIEKCIQAGRHCSLPLSAFT